MRWTLIVLIGILCSNLAVAQDQTGQAKEVDFLAEKMTLNKRQIGLTTKIIHRKNQTFQDLQKYKESNPKKYAAKVATLYEGTLNSVQLFLETKEQKEAYRLLRIDLRKLKGTKMSQYSKDGLTPEEASNKYYSEVFFP